MSDHAAAADDLTKRAEQKFADSRDNQIGPYQQTVAKEDADRLIALAQIRADLAQAAALDRIADALTKN
jgi:hypothetical protein